MSNLKNSFRDFFFFYKEIAYLITLSYLVLIIVIVVLSLIIKEQNDTNRFLRNGIIRQETTQYVVKPHVNKLLESEYRMLLESPRREELKKH